jgi:dethiobiotin synthetase
MKTILVSGSDTGVGKTRAVGALAALVASRPGGARVQVVKAVESGARADASAGDAPTAVALAVAANRGVAGRVSARTLFSFRAPLSPPDAARAEGARLCMGSVLEALGRLPGEFEFRIIEGAGGLASPVDGAGADWADFAARAPVDAVVLVVANRLGAINQARLLASYCRVRKLPEPCFWLNEATACAAAVRESNSAGLAGAGLGVLAAQRPGEILPAALNAVLLDGILLSR